MNCAKDYANIKSYIETYRIYSKNEYVFLSRLEKRNSYILGELRATKNKRKLTSSLSWL